MCAEKLPPVNVACEMIAHFNNNYALHFTKRWDVIG